METVLIALLVMMVILVSVTTIATGWITAQQTAEAAWDDREERMAARIATGVSIVDAEAQGNTVTLAVRNSGERRLTDFPSWDLIVHLHTAAGQYRVERLSHADAAQTPETWDVVGIYLDASASEPEAYEPGILNPGEVAVLRASLETALDEDATHMAVLGTPNGIARTCQFTVTP